MNGDKKEFVMPAKSILQTEVSMPSILVESGGNFVLPDYMPKVQKVLRLEATATAPARYVGAREAQMSGSVLHTLIYLGEDGEIGATVLPSKYEFAVPFDSDAAVPSISATVDVDSLSYRLGGPRKLNIRTRLRAKPCVFLNEEIVEEQIPATEIAGLNKLYGEIDSVNTQIFNSGEVTVSDSIPISAGENAHLIWCGSNAAVSDAKVTDGGVSVRGEIIAKVLLEDEGSPKFFSKKIPFEEFIEGDARRGAYAYCYANVVSTEASKSSDGEALVDVSFVIESLVDTKAKVSVLKDAFSDKCEGRVEYKTLLVPTLAYSRSGISSVVANVHADGVSNVLDTSGKAVLDELSLSDGKLTASGRCMLNSVCMGEENGISSNEFTVPFKIVTDCDAQDNMSVSGNASLANVRARVDNGNIAFDMDIALCARVTSVQEVQAASKLDFTSAKPYGNSEYPLCLIYSGGESLWSLAKKYHIEPKTLAKVNSLDISEADYQNPEKLASLRALMLELK